MVLAEVAEYTLAVVPRLTDPFEGWCSDLILSVVRHVSELDFPSSIDLFLASSLFDRCHAGVFDMELALQVGWQGDFELFHALVDFLVLRRHNFFY